MTQRDLLGPSLVVGIGLINTSQQIGGALGVAVLKAVASGRTESVSGAVDPATALNEGFQAGLLVAAGIVVGAAALGSRRRARLAPQPRRRYPQTNGG